MYLFFYTSQPAMDENILFLVIDEKVYPQVSTQVENHINSQSLPFIKLTSNVFFLPVEAERSFTSLLNKVAVINKDFFLFKLKSSEAFITKAMKDWVASRIIQLDKEELSLSEAVDLIAAWAQRENVTQDFINLSQYVYEQLEIVLTYDFSPDKCVSKKLKEKYLRRLEEDSANARYAQTHKYLSPIYTRLME